MIGKGGGRREGEKGRRDGEERRREREERSALIKKKRKFSSYIRNSEWSSCKAYMRKDVLIYEEMRKYLVLFEEAVNHI